MRSVATADVSLPDVSPGEMLRKDVIAAGALAGILLNIYSLTVALFTVFGGGIVAGFLAGYALGGIRGVVNGVAAGAVVGAAAGGLIGLTGWLMDLYLQPPTVVATRIGLIPAMFAGNTLLGLLLIVTVVAVLVAIDALLGALVGAAVKSGIREIKDLRE